jgi:A/G-specific adenine glycosylase
MAIDQSKPRRTPVCDRLHAMTAQDSLLAWSDRALRRLPWRETRDPWSVLVSEVMLQQTQVPRVVPAYDAFLRRFPTVTVCAESDQGEVVAAWQGLGYNRRAVSLHRTARAVVERHGGRFPSGLDDLLELPGIGPYTARALLAFAFERDVGVVDVNAARVLVRLSGQTLSRRDLQPLADRMVPPGRGWRWNQAILDLGAGICRRGAPACDICPLAHACAWRTAGGPDPALSPGVAGRRQSPFEGSDRQGRSRLLRALLQGPVAGADVPAACGWPHDPERSARAAAALVQDGLARRTPEGLALA